MSIRKAAVTGVAMVALVLGTAAGAAQAAPAHATVVPASAGAATPYDEKGPLTPGA